MYLSLFSCQFDNIMNFKAGYKYYTDRHMLLAALCNIFGHDSRQNLQILYSIEKTDSQYILYVQSKFKPNGKLNGFELVDCISIDHIVDNFKTGAAFSFDILTLPYHNKCDKSVSSERKACYKTEYERISWLKRQGDKYGFDLIFANETTKDRVRFVNKNHRTGKQNHGAFSPYLYTGVLVITDEDKFKQAFISGVGPEKCWGLGMMQLSAA